MADCWNPGDCGLPEAAAIPATAPGLEAGLAAQTAPEAHFAAYATPEAAAIPARVPSVPAGPAAVVQQVADHCAQRPAVAIRAAARANRRSLAGGSHAGREAEEWAAPGE